MLALCVWLSLLCAAHAHTSQQHAHPTDHQSQTTNPTAQPKQNSGGVYDLWLVASHHWVIYGFDVLIVMLTVVVLYHRHHFYPQPSEEECARMQIRRKEQEEQHKRVTRERADDMRPTSSLQTSHTKTPLLQAQKDDEELTELEKTVTEGEAMTDRSKELWGSNEGSQQLKLSGTGSSNEAVRRKGKVSSPVPTPPSAGLDTTAKESDKQK